MNTTTTRMLMRCAILLCSASVPCEEDLAVFTGNYIKSKGFTIKQEAIVEQVEKYNMGATLYGKYRDNIEKIQKLNLIKEIYRSLWTYKFVADCYEFISPAQLLSLLNDKYENEKIYKEDLDRNTFGTFKVIDREFCTSESLKAGGKVLSHLSNDFETALERLSKTFTDISGLEYLSEIYSIDSLKAASASVVSKSDTPKATMQVAPAEKADIVIESAVAEEPTSSDKTNKIELQLRDEIRILKNDKHDLEVKLSYAKKDAIREFICTLTGYGWNCPLSELYRLLKEDDTPEKIKGIINNLFMALGSENVKIGRDKIGEEIILTEENQKTYEPYKYEQLFLGDKAEIFYPGYKYEREVMVRPVVRSIKDKENESNENG